MNKNIEERLFDWKDWKPLIGIFHLIRRMDKINYKLRYSNKMDSYVAINGMYNGAIFYGLDKFLDSLI